MMSRILAALKRVLRVPSFRVAYVISLLPPLALLCWAFVDAHFWNAMRTFGRMPALMRHLPAHWRRVQISEVWQPYGDRLLILTALIAVATVASVIVMVRLFHGTKRDRSLLSWMLAILLIALWSGALLGIGRYPDAQLRYRIRRDSWRYRVVADAITSAGKISRSIKTEIGEISCDTIDTDRWPSYFRPDNPTVLGEEIARVWTLDDGALLFTIYPAKIALEFHPRGKRPGQRYSKAKYGLDGVIVPCLEELGDGWFLGKRSQP
jgi:hypothetical protein